MKRPSAASLKRVTAENLARLGAARLAEILVEVAGTRVELKRRLRMELAAELGPEHLLPEIDRRLTLLAASRGKVTWRQRPAFVRDLDGVRGLIADRLAALDVAAAQERISRFLALASRARLRVKDAEGAVERVFARAAAEAVVLMGRDGDAEGGARLAATLAAQPADWARWAATALPEDRPGLARAALAHLRERAGPDWAPVMRRLADVAKDPDAFRATFADATLATPAVAAEVAQRFLAAGRLEDARAALQSAVRPSLFRRAAGRAPGPDFAWESAWIDYLEQSGRGDEAQAARWASFERTLSADRARAYVKRLPDFEDVEAEQRVFDAAAGFPDPLRALELLIAWPALREAAGVIAERGDQLRPDPEAAEAWARSLRRRYPAAAERLLRRAAAEAFRRRAYATSTRLREEADSIQA
jgi:hypothetical protein